MIRLNREQLAADGRRIEPDAAWFEEARRRTNALLTAPLGERLLDERFYKRTTVKQALEALSQGKCAYCETPLGVAGSWDVEHYRPKGRVDGAAGHPGYYWLAYEWTNLLPSCEFCNQRLTDPGTFEEPIAGPSAGKLDQFPLQDETQRCWSESDPLERERPLLLDPMAELPIEHMSFDVDGRVDPRTESGRVTARICHLDRRRLREARRDVIVKAVFRIRFLQQLRAEGASITHQLQVQQLVEELLGDAAPYAAAARAVVADPSAFGI